MTTTVQIEPKVIRTERGLVLAGTRLTLYQIIDYLEARWPHEEIRALHGLTEPQLGAMLDYIESHREEVMAEYRAVVRAAEEDRRYWEERNRERFAELEARPLSPEKAAIRATIRARLKQLESAT